MARTNSTACAAALTPKQVVRTVDKLAALKAQICPMNMLSRRLAKIETVLMPAPARPVVLLAAPPECANEAMRENYRDELAAARQSGALIVIVAERGDVHEPGCKIVRS